MSWYLRTLGFGVAAAALCLGAIALRLGAGVRHVIFAQPLWLLLALVPLAAMAARAVFAPTPATMHFTRKRSFERIPGGFATYLADLPDGLRLGAVLVLVVACARPQSTRLNERIEHEGIDIAIALDLSESMKNDDLRPDRLTAAKLVIDDFIARRPNDRVALVAFGSSASTIAPLTMDHGVLRNLIGQIRLGVMDGNQTAIGAGLGVALNRLEESDAKSKIVVLLTDGVHNADGVDPDSVAQKAAERGVIIYTVLMGRHSTGAASVDSGQLERLASATGGYAYLAEDVGELQTSFQDLLNKLERSEIEGEQIRAELFGWLLWPVLLLLMLDIGLRNTRLRRFP
ncbi:von Willebrand factor type A domain protein [Enhygromyxa salina]|uniref:von Willebrand factor type A domain protein n=1 Tax=Enhygromyxa salina TaxID=215803 RepID=A0A2S9YET1_9BACT|nr:VWA domain-containing protein [Enhygromyxa salina]PRQ03516.1 von Willebrand factor type A domain protein [Enhygromyxa salina]